MNDKYDYIFEFEKLRFEINYTASQMLIDFCDIHSISSRMKILEDRMREWESRAKAIADANPIK